jgi:hypothetical protein
MVDVSGTTVHVAPVRYAMFANVAIAHLQHAEKGDTDAVGLMEDTRIEAVDVRTKLYERANRAVRKLTKRDEEISIFVLQQRYLYSNDAGIDPAAKRWSNWGLQPSKQRESSIDDAVLEETRLRYTSGAVRVLNGLVSQHGDSEYFSRNKHLALGFNPDLADPTPKYVFIPRDLGYANLHHIVRGAIGEALEYRFRYREILDLTFIVALSRSVSKSNEDAIRLLNHYKILVLDYDQEENRYVLRGRVAGNAAEDLHWLRKPKHHLVISKDPSFATSARRTRRSARADFGNPFAEMPTPPLRWAPASIDLENWDYRLQKLDSVASQEVRPRGNPMRNPALTSDAESFLFAAPWHQTPNSLSNGSPFA